MLTPFYKFLFSKKILILLTIMLRSYIYLDQPHTLLYNEDIPIEQLFGKKHLKNCYELQTQFESDPESGTHNALNYLLYKNAHSNKRITQILRSKKDDTKRFIAKTSSTQNLLTILKNLPFPLKREKLKSAFLTQKLPRDFQFCPQQNIQEFVEFFSVQSGFDEITVWILLLTNVQLLLQPYLEKHNFPVPETVGMCGLTIYEEYVGNTLQYFENANFEIRLCIAIQLLDLAFKFTEGMRGYRIYITDLTSDNLIYNTIQDKLYLIDLDTVYIVDGNSTNSEVIDYHDYIECNNCFAFIPERLCAHGLSDLNILSACLYLRYNLKKDGTKGFLQPIPEQILLENKNMLQLLDECVGVSADDAKAGERMSRFEAAASLRQLFKNIVEK